MKKVYFILFLFVSLNGLAQHTFSIVAVDSVTGEIGSAGATCGDSIVWPGTPGAKLISDVLPGIGAIHTQSYYLKNNQTNANTRMKAGDSPAQIIAWLVANDDENDATIRQYGVVDFNKGHPRAAGFTGSSCMDYKNHIIGKHYSIQGNILLGPQVLDSMQSRFNNSKGTLADKLMAAMQGANMVGADSRCMANGTSSLSAFLRVAKPSDKTTALYLDLNIAATSKGAEPIQKLQEKYNIWKFKLSTDLILKSNLLEFQLYPNPVTSDLTIITNPHLVDEIKILNPSGQMLYSQFILSHSTNLGVSQLDKGLYFINIYKNQQIVGHSKINKF